MKLALAGLLVAACGPSARSSSPPTVDVGPGVDVAVYAAGTTRATSLASGYAIVVERREMELRAGVSDVVFDRVPTTLEPGSVSVRSFSDPIGTRVLGQTFEGDAPILAWRLEVARTGAQLIEVVYTARDIGWWMDYVVVVDVRGDTPVLDLSGWASVANESDFSAESTSLRLVAGVGELAGARAWQVAHPFSFEPRTTAQVSLLERTTGHPARIEHRFEPLGAGELGGQPTDQYVGSVARSDVAAYLAFDSPQALPAGSAAVMMHRVGAAEPVSLGAVPIGPAGAGETVRLGLGRSRNLRGTRQQRAYNHDFTAKRINEAVVIRVHNGGAETARVTVSDRLYRAADARVVNAHPEPAVVANGRVDQVLEIPAGQAREASYEAVYFLD